MKYEKGTSLSCINAKHKTLGACYCKVSTEVLAKRNEVCVDTLTLVYFRNVAARYGGVNSPSTCYKV